MNHDRFGEPIEDDDPDTPIPLPHDPRCRKGWIDRDGDHPIPCLQCKPHLAPAERRRNLGLGDKT